MALLVRSAAAGKGNRDKESGARVHHQLCSHLPAFAAQLSLQPLLIPRLTLPPDSDV